MSFAFFVRYNSIPFFLSAQNQLGIHQVSFPPGRRSEVIQQMMCYPLLDLDSAASFPLRMFWIQLHFISVLHSHTKVGSDIKEGLLTARNCDTSHWMMVSEFFFSLAQQTLKQRLVQVRYWNHKSFLLALSNIDHKVAFWDL